jgi:tetratricopeptide (TPR) repeat protein
LFTDDLGQYRKALEFYQQALAIRREVSDKKGEGVTLNNMGIVYFYWGQYAKALEFYQQALVIRREVSDKNGEARTLNNMGIVYDQPGTVPQSLGVLSARLSYSSRNWRQGGARNNPTQYRGSLP